MFCINIYLLSKLDNDRYRQILRKKLSSNKSTEEEVSLKKLREENPDDSIGLETDDIFSQGLKSPDCVKILFNCCKT